MLTREIGRLFIDADDYMPISLLQSQLVDFVDLKAVIKIDAANEPEWIVNQIRDIC